MTTVQVTVEHLPEEVCSSSSSLEHFTFFFFTMNAFQPDVVHSYMSVMLKPADNQSIKNTVHRKCVGLISKFLIVLRRVLGRKEAGSIIPKLEGN